MKYKFSIILPIYNVEKYLKKAILNIVNQSIGFRDNVQLILVNDGSPDNSEKICQKYTKKYSKNIIYVKQENGGVSSARNLGMKYAEGEYINFLDSDDYLNLDVLELVYKFFEKHQNEIDLVAIRMKKFEASNGYSLLDYKFYETRIVDLQEEYQCFQIFVNSCFIKINVAKKFLFSVNLKFGEDSEYVNSVLLEQKKYGLLREAVYNYRIRKDKSNAGAISNLYVKKEWYINVLNYYYLGLIEKSKKMYGNVPKFIQCVILHSFKKKLIYVPETRETLTNKEYSYYLKEMKNLTSEFEDEIILQYKKMSIIQKVIVFSLKYKCFYDSQDIPNEHLEKKMRSKILFIDKIKLKNEKSILQGHINSFHEFNLNDIHFENQAGEIYNLNCIEDNRQNIYSLENKLVCQKIKFVVEFDIRKFKNVHCCYKQKNIFENLKINFDHKLNISDNQEINIKNYIVKYNRKLKVINIKKQKNKMHKLIRNIKNVLIKKI